MHGEPAPVVSVIIPTYNRADYVQEAVASVLAQTFTDHEIIVVNDGSVDDTAERLRPLAESGRIRYFEQTNGGHSPARNHGLERARGEFVAFLDDDDVWPPEKLAWQVEVLREDAGAGVVYGQKLDMGSDVAQPGAYAPEGDVFKHLATKGWIQSPGQVLIRKSLLDRSGGFDPAFWGTEDWDLWLRLARITRFCYRARPALIYRRHATNTSKSFLRMWRNGHAVIRKTFQGLSGSEASQVRRAAERFVDNFAADDGFVRAYQLMAAGRLRPAAGALLQVARIRGWKGPDWLFCRACFRLAKLTLAMAMRGR